jgi:hypothetical protein
MSCAVLQRVVLLAAAVSCVVASYAGAGFRALEAPEALSCATCQVRCPVQVRPMKLPARASAFGMCAAPADAIWSARAS